jgi:hypothetical protein
MVDHTPYYASVALLEQRSKQMNINALEALKIAYKRVTHEDAIGGHVDFLEHIALYVESDDAETDATISELTLLVAILREARDTLVRG